MMKVNRKKLSLAVMQALSASAAVGFAAAPAYAADAPTPPVERFAPMTITGSRIPSPNLESTSPISTINPQDIKFEHPVSTEQLLNSLPQLSPELGSNISNGATGTATANLRGLGSTRTLVLLNGRRLPPGSPLQGGYAPDLNQIPTQLIQ